MFIGQTLIESLALPVFSLFSFSRSTRIFLPFILLLFSLFILTLAQGAGFIGQLSSGIGGIAAGFILVDVFKSYIMQSGRIMWLRSDYKYLVISIITLITIYTIHNLYDFSRIINPANEDMISSVRPWGIVVNFILLLYSANIFLISDTAEAADYKNIAIIVFLASIFVFVLEMSVVGGFIKGNTEKITAGLGGQSLGNMSTNETGVLSCTLLLWNINSVLHQKIPRVLGISSALMCFIVIVLTKSRVSLILALLVMVIAFLESNVKLSKKITLLVPALIVAGVIAMNVVSERTEVEYGGPQQNTTSLQDIPGSGRPIIWFYYLDAWIYTAGTKPWVWLVGVGGTGLIDLYEITPLPVIGMILKKAYYYPLHSDLVKIFLDSGLIGLSIWIYFLFWMIKHPKKRENISLGIGAITIFIIFTSVDMLIYSPATTLLLSYGIFSSLKRNVIQLNVHIEKK